MSERIPGISPATIILFPLAAAAIIGLFSVSQSYGEHERAVARIDREMLAERQSMRLLDAEWAYLTRPQRLEQLMVARQTGVMPEATPVAVVAQADEKPASKTEEKAVTAETETKKDDKAETVVAMARDDLNVVEEQIKKETQPVVINEKQAEKTEPVQEIAKSVEIKPEVVVKEEKTETAVVEEVKPAPVKAAVPKKTEPKIAAVKTAPAKSVTANAAPVDDVYKPAKRTPARIATSAVSPVAAMPVMARPVAAAPVRMAQAPMANASTGGKVVRTSVSPNAGGSRPIMEASATVSRNARGGVARPIVE